MLNPSTFMDIVSGRRRGVGAGLLRGLLRVGEVGYSAAVRSRNRMFDAGVKKVHRVDVPIVSVGNLTLGGTGKTPMVRWLARWFIERGVRPAVVSRGYGSAAGQMNDEALEMRLLLPEVTHLQNPDRVTAAREAIEKHDAQVIILDDGFQHRRIARDLDIVLLDALCPFGFDHVFPRGMLREPISSLRRAGAVVLSRADMIESSQREAIWRVVRRYAPDVVSAEAAHAPKTQVGKGDSPHLPERPEGCFAQMGTVPFSNPEPTAAFCGLGNPAGFRRTLERCGCRVVDFREFPDHHRYSDDDLNALDRWAERLDVSTVLCTCKDIVKINRDQLGGKPLRAVEIEIDFLAGRETLESLLHKQL